MVDNDDFDFDDKKEMIFDDDFEKLSIMEDQDGLQYLYYSFCDIYGRELTDAERKALRESYPYIEIANPDVTASFYSPPTHHLGASGWHIVDRTHHLIMGPGRERLGPYTPTNGQEDEDGGTGLPTSQPTGSLGAQGMLAVQELMMVAFDRWDAVEVIGGTERLIKIAAHLAERAQKKLLGHKTSFADQVRFHNINMLNEFEVRDLIGESADPKLKK